MVCVFQPGAVPRSSSGGRGTGVSGFRVVFPRVFSH